MNCPRVRELLPRYVDGDLEGAEREMVSQHLAGCAACRQRQALHGRLVTALAELPPLPGEAAAAARLRQKVMQQVEGGGPYRSPWQAAIRLGNALGWAAVSVIAVGLVLALALTWRSLTGQPAARPTTPATATPAETPLQPGPTGTAAPGPAPTTEPGWPTEQPTGVPGPAPTVAPVAPTGIPGPAPEVQQYANPILGFSVECPGNCDVSAYAGDVSPAGVPAGAVTFATGYAVAGGPGTGSYAIHVTVIRATVPSAADMAAAWLNIVTPTVREGIGRRSLTVDGEAAVELNPLPGPDGRAVWVVHNGWLYVLRFTPYPPLPADVAARQAFDSFLATFRFTAMAQPPAPTSTSAPVPTPTPAAGAPTPSATQALTITSLVVTPGEPPVLYAVINARLYRSADQGRSWAEESRGGLPAEARFDRVALDYRHPETMYAATDAGIYRRQGAGDWGLVNTLRVTALAVDLLDPAVLWAGVYWTTASNATILKSEDAGRTWGKADYGIDPIRAWTPDILVDPNDPSILWAVVRGDPGREWMPGRIYRGGRDGHWERLDLGQFEPLYTNVDSCHIAGIAYDPNANRLFAGCDLSYYNQGNLLLLRSPNADAAGASAVTWEVAARFGPESPAATGAVRPLAVDAREPGSLFVSTTVSEFGKPRRSGILVSHDGGLTWELLDLAALLAGPGD